jgi:rare lipoprotein A
VSNSGFLGAATPLAAGVIESDQPAPAVSVTPVQPVTVQQSAPVTAPGSVQGSVQAAVPAASGHYVVQVGAVSDQTRANQWQQKLSQQFGVPGKVSSNGAMFRVQLGPFNSKGEAAALQQRLMSEAQQQSFITNAPAM